MPKRPVDGPFSVARVLHGISVQPVNTKSGKHKWLKFITLACFRNFWDSLPAGIITVNRHSELDFHQVMAS
jgi:hypothetical protein